MTRAHLTRRCQAVLTTLPLWFGLATQDVLGQASTPETEATPEASSAVASWQALPTGSDASLRGLSAVSAEVAWAGGSEGTVLRTVDGGKTWTRHPVPGAEELQFRDIEALDDQQAILMTAGHPARLYRTDDGGASFTLTHESPHEAAFFDGFDFWDAQRGLVMSDPVDGVLLLLLTDDGGRSWQRIPAKQLPPTLDGEAGFAASGTNVAVAGSQLAWVGTGGQAARVFRTQDGGQSWSVSGTPLASGASSKGIFSIAFRDAKHGLALGGDYQDAESSDGNVARSVDGGKTWQTIQGPPPGGHRACVVHLPDHSKTTWLAVGRAGTDLSFDDGESWTPLSKVGFYAADVADDGTVWAVGDAGRAARLEWAETSSVSSP